jgi:hypothetical protein
MFLLDLITPLPIILGLGLGVGAVLVIAALVGLVALLVLIWKKM